MMKLQSGAGWVGGHNLTLLCSRSEEQMLTDADEDENHPSVIDDLTEAYGDLFLKRKLNDQHPLST